MRSPRLAGCKRARALYILTGAVSGASWYTAFGLGTLLEFNGVVRRTTLPGQPAFADARP